MDAEVGRGVADWLRRLAAEVEALVAPGEAPAPANEDWRPLLEWYRRRAARLLASSEAENLQAAAFDGHPLTRECVRLLRRELAPEAWRCPGRRRA